MICQLRWEFTASGEEAESQQSCLSTKIPVAGGPQCRVDAGSALSCTAMIGALCIGFFKAAHYSALVCHLYSCALLDSARSVYERV